MTTDLTFITIEENQNLLERFRVLIKDTRFFDVLAGYFYSSGFNRLYPFLEPTKKIRILIGISTDKQTFQIISQAHQSSQQSFIFSHAEVKDHFSDRVADEMEHSEDEHSVEKGVYVFMDWLKSGRLKNKCLLFSK